MTRRLTLLCLVLALTQPLAAQETPTTRPAAEPAVPSEPETLNPRRSPQSMVEHFQANFDAAVDLAKAIEKAEEGADVTEQQVQLDRLEAEALLCLDAAAVDAERWQQDKWQYATQLAEILGELEGRGVFDPGQLPTDPAATPAPVIGSAELALALQRIELLDDAGEATGRFVWVFSNATVKAVPEFYQRLDNLGTEDKEEKKNDREEVVERAYLDQLRTPAGMLSFFLNQQTATQSDTTAYTRAAECIDFGELVVDQQADGPLYVDNIARVLLYLINDEGFDPQTSTQVDPTQSILAIPSEMIAGVQVTLVRKADGAWLFDPGTAEKSEEWANQIARYLEQKGKSGDLATIPLDTSSMRSTLNLFLQAMSKQDLQTAMKCFDTSEMERQDRTILQRTAGKLWLILNRHKKYTPATMKVAEGQTREVLLTHAAGRIELIEVKRGDRVEWLFSPATIRAIDALYAAYSDQKEILPAFRDQRVSFVALPGLYIREYLVSEGYKDRWNGLEAWQWLGILVSFALSLLAYFLTARIAPPVVRRILSTRDAVILPATVRSSLRPLFFLAFVGTLSIGLRMLDFPADEMNWVIWTLKMVATVLGVWAAYQIIDLGTAFFSVVAARTKSRLDDVLVPLLQKTLKVVAAAIGGIVVANAFGANVGPLLAGLGVGGLAFGLAAQDTLKNFFGSVNVVLDRPFQVGDWVRVGDTEGTIEAVGLRSTRIRTFYNSEITVPNSNLMTTSIDNMGRRRYRRISMQLGVTYSTKPEQLDAFCEGIRELIREHPYTRKDYFHVYLHSFGSSSINILLYCFHECPDWGIELRERHRLLLDIMRLARRIGVEFAFPTQTVHLHHDRTPESVPPETPPVPSERTEAEVFGRDQAGAVLRDFPPAAEETPKP